MKNLLGSMRLKYQERIKCVTRNDLITPKLRLVTQVNSMINFVVKPVKIIVSTTIVTGSFLINGKKANVCPTHDKLIIGNFFTCVC